jgi:hypothetical protein
MADARHEQTLTHLRLLAGLPGYWELRALRRDGVNENHCGGKSRYCDEMRVLMH